MSRFKFIKLNNGKVVPAMYQAYESEVSKTTFRNFDFKELSDGKVAQKIVFVDSNGDQIEV